MTACSKCGATIDSNVGACGVCGAHASHPHAWLGGIYAYVPHPHIEWRKRNAPKAADASDSAGPITRFNSLIGAKITEAVGTMWCAYAFAALALVSLPEAIKGGTAPLIAWIAQTFIQLVLLSIIMVGQKIAGEATDKRAVDTYNDAEAVLHEAVQIQQHLLAQDAFLQQLIEGLLARRPSAAESQQAGGTANDPAPSNC